MAVLESTSPKVPKGLTGDKFAQSLHKGNRSFFGMQTANIHISTVIPSIDRFWSVSFVVFQTSCTDESYFMQVVCLSILRPLDFIHLCI